MTNYTIGWIKLHRKLLEWEWYGDINVRVTFLHMLLLANYEPKKWQGRDIQRGSFISSVGKLSKQIGISEMQLRTAIKKLILTNDITSESTSLNTMYTIVSYDSYQTDNEQSNAQSSSEQQTANKRLTTTEEVNNKINKKDNKFNFKKSLIELGVDEQIADDYIIVRKNKKAVNTKTAFNSLVSEINKSNKDANFIIKLCVSNSWGGFNSSWDYEGKQKQTSHPMFSGGNTKWGITL